MDALSEILSGVKLNGAIYFQGQFSEPWGVAAPEWTELAPLLAPGAPHLLMYHFVLEGTAYAHMSGERTLRVNAGEIVVIPQGLPHVLTSDGNRPLDGESNAVQQKLLCKDLIPLEAGGGGALARIICGFVSCEPEVSRPVLNGLPKMFCVNLDLDDSGVWMRHAIGHMVSETARGTMGSEAMLAKLSEALFVDALRRYIAEMPEGEMGWLAGARDTAVGKALGLMHSRMMDSWTIAELAREVGLSRSALVERFSKYIGEPPIAYLTRLRLQRAARALTSTALGVGEIAARTGYESEAAFHRAFKREFGVPPARYRREAREAQP